jgi:methyl-accepting chemotaxis protein
MSDGGECELYCDLDAMDELARQLDSIHAALDDVGDRVDAYDARLGSRRIEEAVDHFVSGWRDGRKEIRGMVEASAATVRKAAETYRVVEGKLMAASGGDPPA